LLRTLVMTHEHLFTSVPPVSRGTLPMYQAILSQAGVLSCTSAGTNANVSALTAMVPHNVITRVCAGIACLAARVR
jgi:hypothetical protein